MCDSEDQVSSLKREIKELKERVSKLEKTLPREKYSSLAERLRKKRVRELG